MPREGEVKLRRSPSVEGMHTKKNRETAWTGSMNRFRSFVASRFSYITLISSFGSMIARVVR